MLTAFQCDRYATLAARDVHKASADDFTTTRDEFVHDCREELRDEYRGDFAGFELAVNQCAEIFTNIWNGAHAEASEVS